MLRRVMIQAIYTIPQGVIIDKGAIVYQIERFQGQGTKNLGFVLVIRKLQIEVIMCLYARSLNQGTAENMILKFNEILIEPKVDQLLLLIGLAKLQLLLEFPPKYAILIFKVAIQDDIDENNSNNQVKAYYEQDIALHHLVECFIPSITQICDIVAPKRLRQQFYEPQTQESKENNHLRDLNEHIQTEFDNNATLLNQKEEELTKLKQKCSIKSETIEDFQTHYDMQMKDLQDAKKYNNDLVEQRVFLVQKFNAQMITQSKQSVEIYQQEIILLNQQKQCMQQKNIDLESTIEFLKKSQIQLTNQVTQINDEHQFVKHEMKSLYRELKQRNNDLKQKIQQVNNLGTHRLIDHSLESYNYQPSDELPTQQFVNRIQESQLRQNLMDDSILIMSEEDEIVESQSQSNIPCRRVTQLQHNFQQIDFQNPVDHIMRSSYRKQNQNYNPRPKINIKSKEEDEAIFDIQIKLVKKIKKNQ